MERPTLSIKQRNNMENREHRNASTNSLATITPSLLARHCIHANERLLLASLHLHCKHVALQGSALTGDKNEAD